ncbi:putative glycerol-3-phosphate o-acyltransferase protein [Botrytis fragariae]|uniref:Putative glycerol-3-phosphate o-acyltransferase protein n=1 Tax=Botrytis fragariae TaxID=1964551 RepID=A0A8H6B5T6_9HELO|nr:putative glycerol-3-phosphate o-acyltransferase protein [Botrytis fragariae]KAF5879522.1 putative glycerol-3-phosphate o-acyltransferase protein [Botrytis fragariae]
MANEQQVHEHMPRTAKHKEQFPMTNWIYDVFLWTFSILVDLFFREVHPRGAWKVPRRGPVIFVAAPHANQFVDPLILMRTLRNECHRRAAFLIAAKSMGRFIVGWFARKVGAVPVGRALDMVKPGSGTIYLPDPINDPLLIRGVGTKFDGKEVQVGGLLVLPTMDGTAANTEIAEVISAEELRLKKPFKGRNAMVQLTGRTDVDENGKFGDQSVKGTKEGFEGSKYKTAPKVDQTQVYDAVFDRLKGGGAVGIFPEGGSHDRTELLPLKAGVAIMALGSLAANPDSGLQIVPCGMNYFHAHKFRSRAVIEFGNPIEVPKELVELYKSGDRRGAVSQLLDIVYQALVAVTVTSPDYDTLMLIQAARRLYNPTGKKLPLPMVVELNRRLVKGYTHYKDDPRIVSLKKSVLDYNRQLRYMNLKDHQVEYAKFSVPKAVFLLFYRLGKLAVLSIGVIPGLVLFAPVFIASKIISIKKSKEALAASTVKLQGRDVMATWKLLVALAFAPILYNFYTIILAYWTYKNRVQGYVPEWVPLYAIFVFGYILFPAITFAALRFGEVGMDIAKSLRPLIVALNPSSSNVIFKLRERRAQLSAQVTDVINTLGPEMFPDFDASRIVADPFNRDGAKTPTSPRQNDLRRGSNQSGISDGSPPRVLHRSNTAGASIGGGSSMNGHLPRNESFGNLGNIALFATRPPSRSRSRSSSSGGAVGSAGFPLKSFSALDGKASFDEVSQKIRGAMKERGQLRRRQSEVNREEEDAAYSSGDEERKRA